VIHLNISDNQLSTLPYSFGDLSQLKLLYLENNRLEQLPDSFSQLQNLRNLDLQSNKLRSLKGLTGNQLRHLDHFHVYDNPIPQVELELAIQCFREKSDHACNLYDHLF